MTMTATTTQHRIGNNNVSDDGEDGIDDDNQKHTCFRFIINISVNKRKHYKQPIPAA